jgi:hypothetical protein
LHGCDLAESIAFMTRDTYSQNRFRTAEEYLVVGPLRGGGFFPARYERSNQCATCSGASPRYALWGEMMSARARKLGAAGAVVDGYSRDTPGILKLSFPTFSRGRYAQDQGLADRLLIFGSRFSLAKR